MVLIDNFRKFEAGHCETAATKSLLLHHAMDFSEPMMLGLSQGFGFIYWKMSFMNLPFIGGRAKPFELTRVFCRNMGFELDERETSSKKKAWRNIEEPLSRGVPVGLQLDCYHLEHFRHSFHFAGHFVSVYGYDLEYAYIFDTGETYKVSLENLERARFEKGSMAARARSYTIVPGKAKVPVDTVIPKALHEISKEFLNPPLQCFGYKGILKLGKEMLNWFDCTEHPEKDFHDQAELMENGGTGGAVFRNFFRDFLHESQDYLPGNENIAKAADLYGAAARNWTEIARLIKTAGDTADRRLLSRASEICVETAGIEREAMELLGNIK